MPIDTHVSPSRVLIAQNIRPIIVEQFGAVALLWIYQATPPTSHRIVVSRTVKNATGLLISTVNLSLNTVVASKQPFCPLSVTLLLIHINFT